MFVERLERTDECTRILQNDSHSVVQVLNHFVVFTNRLFKCTERWINFGKLVNIGECINREIDISRKWFVIRITLKRLSLYVNTRRRFSTIYAISIRFWTTLTILRWFRMYFDAKNYLIEGELNVN